jgi:31-O-methyltransferase
MIDASKRAKYLRTAVSCCRNGREILHAYLEGRPLPAIILRSGLTIRHQPSDPMKYVFYEIFGAEVYTRSGFYVPSSHDTVIDCGANIGLFAFYLANNAPGIQVHCFEPASDTRRRLEMNLKSNRLNKSIHVYPFAIFGEAGTKLLRHAESTGDHSFFDRSTIDGKGEELVECVTLQQALNLSSALQIDLLKIDAEGSEIEIIEGANSNTWERVKRVVVEFHDDFRPGSRDRIFQAFQGHGFRRLHLDEAFPCSASLGLVKAGR